jgi:hypothetical protein
MHKDDLAAEMTGVDLFTIKKISFPILFVVVNRLIPIHLLRTAFWTIHTPSPWTWPVNPDIA